MKLEKLHIYGYGKLQDVQLSLSSVTILYGENEAGKSTIRSFIKSILFGFPTRGQLRYEPKEGGAYGGAITIQSEQYGHIRVERIPKTASGEVTVYFEDGSMGGEQELKQLLQGLDSSLFESVFCFDMHGLQNIHQVKKEELGNYLFSAGAVGTDTLLQMEKKLDREMEALFKPNGRKPSINVGLSDLHKLKDSFQAWQKKIGQYEKWQQLKKEGELQVEKMQQEKKRRNRLIKDDETMITLAPLLLEKQKHEDFLATIPETSFPAQGVLRYEQLLAKWRPVQLRLQVLADKIEEGKKEARMCSVNEALLQKEVQIEECRLKQLSYEQAMKEQTVNETRMEQMKEEIEGLQRSIGLLQEKAFFLQLDTSLAAKENLTSMLQQSQRLEEQKQQLDERFSHAKDELDEQEQHLRGIKERMQNSNKRSSSVKQKNVPFLYFILAILAGSLVVFLTNQIMYGTLVFLLIIVAFFVYYRKPSNVQDMELRQVMDREEFKLQQAEKNYERILKQYEEWEQSSFSVEKNLKTWKRQYGLADSLSYRQLLTILERVEKIKNLYREYEKASQKKNSLQREIQQFQNKLDELQNFFQIEEERASDSLYQMREIVKKEQQQKVEYKQLLEKITEWEEEQQELLHNNKILQHERDVLWNASSSHTEEEFYARGKQDEEKQTTLKQVSFLTTQIQLLQERLTELNISDHRIWTEDYHDLLQKQRSQLDTLLLEEQTMQRNLAQYQAEIAGLEEGSTYSDLLHEWEAKKSIIREQMKQWAAYATAKNVLMKTKERYQQVKLPRMLERAEKYFNHVTSGQYVKLFVPNQEQSFLVERYDGMRFAAYELSQATAEQLYLCLRFALADTFDGNIPLIIDDSFVHFDKVRTKQTLSLLRDLSSTRQILFFTCHEGFLSYFSEDETIRLQEKRNVV
ncbi:AAA family ATPase [Ectobacillus sp. sgz5001026]|uniref:ATP-binding protein n=1 Tax=Ectobacillus sp. sgz5001026 TaxID=3242473 RepID=UPI0036D3C4E3